MGPSIGGRCSEYAVIACRKSAPERSATSLLNTQTPRLTLPRDAEQRPAIVLARPSAKPEPHTEDTQMDADAAQRMADLVEPG